MGKQRSKVLANKIKDLYNAYPDKFSEKFDDNKKALDELDLFQSKLQRNMAAGYLVRLAKQEVI